MGLRPRNLHRTVWASKRGWVVLQFGAESAHARGMYLDDIYFLRLKLLLIMAEDCLAGSGMSPVQRRAMLANARHVESESIALGSGHRRSRGRLSPQSSTCMDCFYRFAVDIAVAVQQAAETGSLAGTHRPGLMEKVEALRAARGTDEHPSETVRKF